MKPFDSAQVRPVDSAQRKRAVLWLSTLAFAGFGAAFALAPRRMAATIEVALPTDTARIDFVATYGGLELGFAVFLALCARRKEWVDVGLLASGCALSGLALLRAIGMALSADPGTLMYVVLAMEASGAVLSFWAAARGGRRY